MTVKNINSQLSEEWIERFYEGNESRRLFLLVSECVCVCLSMYVSVSDFVWFCFVESDFYFWNLLGGDRRDRGYDRRDRERDYDRDSDRGRDRDYDRDSGRGRDYDRDADRGRDRDYERRY